MCLTSPSHNLMFRFKFLLAAIALVLMPSFSLATAKWSLTPRLFVEEQYDDNIFLTETNEEDDFITTISPGLNLTYETPTRNINLDYELQRILHAEFSELDLTGHRGRVEARTDFSRRFSAGIREIFIRSEDPIELTGVPTFERPAVRGQGRNRYTRNILEPDATFRFYKNRSIRLGYRNQVLRNDAEDVADFGENAVNALLAFRFDIRNGIEVFYEHIEQDYEPTIPPEPPKDFDGDEFRGRYVHFFDSRTSLFAEYRYFQRDFDRETGDFIDYKVHEPRLGFSRNIHENVSVSASAGYAFRDADGGDDEETFSGRLNFSGRYRRLSTELYGETAFGEDFLSAENLGFNEFWRIGLTGRYQFLERLTGAGYFFVERDRFTDLDRRDKLWNIRCRLDYQLLRWLFVSFDYTYNARDSNIPTDRYRNNRYFARITALYDVAERFQ